MLAPDLRTPEPPRIVAAVEFHQLRPAQDPEPVFSVLNERLEALYRMRASALGSVLPTPSLQPSPTAESSEEGEALAEAVKVIRGILGASGPQ